MSDFKYAAINAVLDLAQRTDEGMGDIWSMLLAGSVPVVDLTGAVKLWRTDEQHFNRTRSAFAALRDSGKVSYPINRFVAFWEEPDHDNPVPNCRHAAIVASVSIGEGEINAYAYVVAEDDSGQIFVGKVVDAESAESVGLRLTLLVDCASMWMAMKNAEHEDVAAPRAARRRYKPLASVRFRRVFIHPMRTSVRGVQPERYEITGDHCPLHHVRGHVRHVSEDRPLFGRKGAHGTFWVREHWRGDEENGRIVQEYVPQPPEGT